MGYLCPKDDMTGRRMTFPTTSGGRVPQTTLYAGRRCPYARRINLTQRPDAAKGQHAYLRRSFPATELLFTGRLWPKSQDVSQPGQAIIPLDIEYPSRFFTLADGTGHARSYVRRASGVIDFAAFAPAN